MGIETKMVQACAEGRCTDAPMKGERAWLWMVTRELEVGRRSI